MSKPPQDARWSLRLTFFFVGALVGILGAFVTFTLLPRQYRATATLQVAPPPGSALSSSAYLDSQYEVILGQSVLEPVIQSLNLPQKWNLDATQTLIRVRSAISVQTIAHTELLQIGALSPDPAHSVELANAIAESYQKLRTTGQFTDKPVAQLQAEIDRQREKVASLQSQPGPALDQALAVLKAAEARLSTESMKTLAPTVTIWERAEPADTSALPLPWLLLLAGPIVGIFLGTALALTVRPK